MCRDLGNYLRSIYVIRLTGLSCQIILILTELTRHERDSRLTNIMVAYYALLKDGCSGSEVMRISTGVSA